MAIWDELIGTSPRRRPWRWLQGRRPRRREQAPEGGVPADLRQDVGLADHRRHGRASEAARLHGIAERAGAGLPS